MSISLVGIDLAKNVFHLHMLDEHGHEAKRMKIQRVDLLSVIARLEKTWIVMEACGGANYWSREFEKLGHRVSLIAAQHVKVFVKRNKNDWKDAEAICEAALRPKARFIPRKTEYQQDVQSLHRIRERLVKNRTAIVNAARGLLLEYGITCPRGRRVFAKRYPELLFENREKLSDLCSQTFYDLLDEYLNVEERIKKLEVQLRSIAGKETSCQHMMSIPGIGFLTATALLASIGDISAFKNGREMAAWLGLTPREHSTGGKQRLFGISKQGDCYIRKLLVHGARVSLRYCANKDDLRSKWAKDLVIRKGMNKAAVAVANKNARTVWALLRNNTDYKTYPIAA